MPLLTFEDVTLVDRTRRHEVALLQNVSFELEAGEWLAVWCPQGAARRALTRVATGIFRPESGVVRLDGQALPSRRSRSIRRQLPLCDARLLDWRECWPWVLPDFGAPRGGRRAVDAVLGRLVVPEPFLLSDDDPEPLERARASLAGGLERGPRALIVEGPVRSSAFGQADHISALVRAIANQGIAVLMTTDDADGMAGADRVVSFSRGTMRGELTGRASASVVPFPAG